MSDQNREFRGVWIPASVWMNEDLSLQEKVMLVEIDSLQHPERGCFKSNKRLAEFFGLSASRVSEIVGSLAKKGWIEVVQIRDGRSIVERRIFMKKPLSNPIRNPEEGYSENSSNPIRNLEEGYSENAEERGSVKRGSFEGVGQKEEKPTRKRKTQLPEGFKPSQAHIDKAEQNNIDLNHEFEQFCNYHLSKGSTFLDWDRALHTWMGNAIKFAKNRPANDNRRRVQLNDLPTEHYTGLQGDDDRWTL